MKKMFPAAVSALCAAMLFCGVSPYAKTTSITQDKAKEAAWQVVPRSCSYLTTDNERYLYEVKYFDKTNQKKYVVQVGKSKGDILELTVQSARRTGGSEVKMTEADAIQTVKALYADALDVKASLKESGGRYWYEVAYRTPFTNGTAKVNAETGEMMERDDLYFQAKDDELGDVVKDTATANTLTRLAVSQESIEKSALAAVPGGTVDRIQLTGDRKLYEVKMHKGDYEYELLYNAATGARMNLASSFDPVDFSSDWYQNPGSVEKQSSRFGLAQVQSPSAVKRTGAEGEYITRDRAIQIAQRCAPSGAKLKSMSLKHDGEKTYYQGWLKLDGVRYAFQIDAVDGSVINSSVEVDESWDPEAHHDVDSEKDEDKDYEMKWDDPD